MATECVSNPAGNADWPGGINKVIKDKGLEPGGPVLPAKGAI